MEKLIGGIARQLLQQRLLLATAESCTGGWVAKTITDLAGSSQWFDRGFVTYSNASKIDMLGVDATLINQYGAVSEAVAGAMAQGALNNSLAQYAVSVTGIAGPGGGTVDKPVGTVCFGWIKKDSNALTETVLFKGSREEIRYQSVSYSLQRLLDQLIN